MKSKNRKIVKKTKNKDKINSHNTHIHDHSLSWLWYMHFNTERRKKNNLFFCLLVWLCKCFLHVGKIPTLTYNLVRIVVVKNAMSFSLLMSIIYLFFATNLKYAFPTVQQFNTNDDLFFKIVNILSPLQKVLHVVYGDKYPN